MNDDIANDPRERKLEDALLSIEMAKADQAELTALRAENERLKAGNLRLSDEVYIVRDDSKRAYARIAELEAARLKQMEGIAHYADFVLAVLGAWNLLEEALKRSYPAALEVKHE